jgi:hypothetical protein
MGVGEWGLKDKKNRKLKRLCKNTKIHIKMDFFVEKSIK